MARGRLNDFKSVRKGIKVKVYTDKVQPSTITSFVSMEAPFSPEDALRILSRESNPRGFRMSIVAILDADTVVKLESADLPWPHRPRECLVLERVYRFDDSIVLLRQGIDEPLLDFSKDNGSVRINVNKSRVGGYVFRKANKCSSSCVVTFIQSVDLLLLDPVIRLLRSTIIKKNAAWLAARFSMAQLRTDVGVSASPDRKASCAVVELRRPQSARVSSASDIAAWSSKTFQKLLVNEYKAYAQSWANGKIVCWVPMLLQAFGSMYVRADLSGTGTRIYTEAFTKISIARLRPCCRQKALREPRSSSSASESSVRSNSTSNPERKGSLLMTFSEGSNGRRRSSMRAVKRGHVLIRKSRSWIRSWSARYLRLTDEGVLHVYKLTASGIKFLDSEDGDLDEATFSWDVGEYVARRAARYVRHCAVTPMGFKDGKYTFMVKENAGSGEESYIGTIEQDTARQWVQALTIASHSLLALNYCHLKIGKRRRGRFGQVYGTIADGMVKARQELFRKCSTGIRLQKL